MKKLIVTLCFLQILIQPISLAFQPLTQIQQGLGQLTRSLRDFVPNFDNVDIDIPEAGNQRGLTMLNVAYGILMGMFLVMGRPPSDDEFIFSIPWETNHIVNRNKNQILEGRHKILMNELIAHFKKKDLIAGKHLDGQDNCPLCQEPLGQGENIITHIQCRGRWHTDCFPSNQLKNCPHCREKLPKEKKSPDTCILQ